MDLNYVDNDILCLEKLVTAILFSDRLLGIDDYKSDYRSARLKNFDFVTFHKFDDATYESLAHKSASFAREMAFSFEGSKPAGDVLSFFEALKIDTQLRWDIFVSSEYLTLSFLLEDPKDDRHERAIDSLFRMEETDRKLVDPRNDTHPAFGTNGRSAISDVKDFIKSLLSRNSSSRGQDGKSALERMVFGYGWAAERAHFYNAAAHNLGSDVYLAPL